MEDVLPLENPPTDTQGAVAILEEEVSKMFGPTGMFIVKKQIEIFKGGPENLTAEDIPALINHITDVMSSLIGPVLAKGFKQTVRKRCGLGI